MPAYSSHIAAGAPAICTSTYTRELCGYIAISSRLAVERARVCSMHAGLKCVSVYARLVHWPAVSQVGDSDWLKTFASYDGASGRSQPCLLPIAS